MKRTWNGKLESLRLENGELRCPSCTHGVIQVGETGEECSVCNWQVLYHGEQAWSDERREERYRQRYGELLDYLYAKMGGR